MAVRGMQLMMVVVTMAMAGALSIRRERVFVMEVKVEETEKTERLTPAETKRAMERLTQETERAMERLTQETERAMERLTQETEKKMMEILSPQESSLVKLTSDPANLPALVKELKLTDLYGAVVAAGLADALSAPGPFTLFAPTNQAFVDAKTWVDQLTSNVTELGNVLKYHVLSGKVMAKDIKDEATVPTLLGKPIRFNIYPKNNVVTAQCAPIDLSQVNKMASNGVLHELTAIMVPPHGNIAATASSLPPFSTLVKALTIAGLVDTLSGDSPFTVFAPTDEAFKKLDPATLNNLLNNKTALTDVLLYHVANLTYCRPGLVSYSNLKMLNNDDVNITVNGDKVMVNDILVMPAGVKGGVTNGVIHVIDTVLLPPSLRSPVSSSSSLHLRP